LEPGRPWRGADETLSGGGQENTQTRHKAVLFLSKNLHSSAWQKQK
jgi:hypothetical protein